MSYKVSKESEVKRIIGLAAAFSALFIVILLTYVFFISPEAEQPPRRSLPVSSCTISSSNEKIPLSKFIVDFSTANDYR